MIDNDGFPDQTYDTWSVTSVSAYCGGLWLVALQAAAALAVEVDDEKSAKYFQSRKALQMVFEYNVMMMNGGKMGAVNGMNLDGTIDESCMQSREIWTGTTYAVAAAIIHEALLL
ncbi:hypothetical protein L7F22_050047 [Adiantum nelumboides]|nr:hypothetical protein [Adiantum nelumboides]